MNALKQLGEKMNFSAMADDSTGPERVPEGTLLIVQSTEDECEQLVAPLSGIGFTVRHTTRTDEAANIYKRDKPGVIILGAFLSAGNAYEFCRRIRTEFHDKKTPIILTSGVMSGTLFVDARSKWGANDVVLLPARMEKIVRLVLFYLGHEKERPALVDSKTEETTRTDFNISRVIPGKKALAPAGDLGEVRIERLLRLLAQNYRTGVLRLGASDTLVTLHILMGALVNVTSPYIAGFSLTDELRRQRAVPEADLARAGQLAEERRMLLGTVLRREGLLSAADLERVLVEQMVRKSLWPFAWPAGPYQYRKVSIEPPSDVNIRVDLGRLIYEGVRSTIDIAQLKETYGNTAELRFTEQPVKGIDLRALPFSAQERRLLQRLGEGQALRTASSDMGVAEDDALRLVAVFEALGTLKRVK